MSVTAKALADITDPGFFERLATAILRQANPTYHSLVHTGVNAEGKTVRSPVDGICFVKGSDEPHMIVAHHTITKRDKLEGKWLDDPSKMKPRKPARSSTLPAPGDLIKTAELVTKERRRTPKLRATLVLTTNEEPDEALIRRAEKAGRERRLEIDLWTRSRLSDFLDNNATGQWIRYKYLGIDQELLSSELLYQLSKRSVEITAPLDDSHAWVSRALDVQLMTSLRRDVTFLVAGSGLGKSVACYRRLAAHVEAGGFGIVLPHEAVASAMSLGQAIKTALRQLHPPLAALGPSPVSFCTPERPLLLVVEDLNRSGQTQHLVERLARWSTASTEDEKDTRVAWRLLCPLWPEVLASLGNQVRKRIEPLIMLAGGFTENEGREAVLARAQLKGRSLSPMSAEAIARELGHDPLLIALHDQDTVPDPHQVISRFVETSLSHAEAAETDYTATDYRQALRSLAGEMLANRQVDLRWSEVRRWEGLQGEHLRLISHLAHHGELIRLTGTSEGQHLSFRHDRVRDWLLADAAAELDRLGRLAEEVVAEPYFAEVMGMVLVRDYSGSTFLHRVATANPLALFHALRLFGQASNPHHEAILQSINRFLDEPSTHDRSNLHLRWAALDMLAQTDSPEVPALVHKFRDRTTSGQLARLRNGDISGGIELCTHLAPGTGAPWRDIQIEHAKHHHGPSLTSALDGFLRDANLDGIARQGALRLAGHFADPGLALAIEACWITDADRSDHLADYIWAFGECCADDPPRFLGPACDAWAALPNKSDKKGRSSTRNALAAHHLRWAFQRWPPVAAIDYFAQRGSQDDLRWPITYMLHCIDHPKAVVFVVHELAATRRRLEKTNASSFHAFLVADGWRRAQEDHGRPMSRYSRDVLLKLWRDETNDEHLRVEAFSLWAATKGADDLEVLRAAKPSAALADGILRQRLIRGDQRAVPAMIEKLATDDQGLWWQYGRYVWSPELSEALDDSLRRRGIRSERIWGEEFAPDWFTQEIMIRLPVAEVEWLLLKHWDHLRFSPCFVQVALYISTPRSLAAARAAIDESSDPAKLLEFLCSSFGIRTKGCPGIYREAQVRALSPFLHFLSPGDIWELWEECNDHGWFNLRQELLDAHLQPPYLARSWKGERAVSELDKMVAEEHPVWRIGRWVDSFLRTGVSWSEVLTVLRTWLDERRSIEALRVVAAAVEHRGTREDLSVLRIHEAMPENAARQLIADTEFAVRRRRIR